MFIARGGIIMICIECKKAEARGGMFCGQAFTDWKCEKCGEIYTHHNTAVPKVCKECSEKYNICEECGRPIDG